MGLNLTCATVKKRSGAVLAHGGAKVGLRHCATTLPPKGG